VESLGNWVLDLFPGFVSVAIYYWKLNDAADGQFIPIRAQHLFFESS
jgi:hypothetical protein